jgi:hypothetical protein
MVPAKDLLLAYEGRFMKLFMSALVLCMGAAPAALALEACQTRVIQGVQCTFATAPGEFRGVDDFLTIGRYVQEQNAADASRSCRADGLEHTTATFVEHCWGCGQGGTYLWGGAATAAIDAAAHLATADFGDAQPDNIIWGLGHVAFSLERTELVPVAFVYGDVSRQHRNEIMKCRPLNNEVVEGWQL